MSALDVVFLCLCVAVAVVASVPKEYSQGVKDRAAAILQSCLAETKLTEGEIMELESTLSPVTEKEKCLLGCLMKKVKVIENGKFSVSYTNELVHAYFKPNDVLIKKITDIVENCAKKVQSTNNECEIGGTIATCGMNEISKLDEFSEYFNKRNAKRDVSPIFQRLVKIINNY